MNISNEVTFSVPAKSIRPLLRIRVTAEYERGVEALLGVSARVLAGDGTDLAFANDVTHYRGREQKLEAREHDERQGKDSPEGVDLEAELSREAIDYLNKMREKDPKKPVSLRLDVQVRSLLSRIQLSRIRLTQQDAHPQRQLLVPIGDNYPSRSVDLLTSLTSSLVQFFTARFSVAARSFASSSRMLGPAISTISA